jgi:hypothetical protein
MLLTAFVIAQLVFDVAALVLLVATVVRRRPAPADARPPEWYPQFLGLAQDLLAATEPVLDALEARRGEGAGGRALPARPEPADRSEPRSRRREVLALLRAGADPREVARRGGLLPGELRLLKNVVAAEAASAPPRET